MQSTHCKHRNSESRTPQQATAASERETTTDARPSDDSSEENDEGDENENNENDKKPSAVTTAIEATRIERKRTRDDDRHTNEG